uniref:Uncharacterized protein n=1 Tax=Aegilops tauschii subsp. strangulata TaxID=200361 RepID=A0A453C5G4_AEGTS
MGCEKNCGFSCLVNERAEWHIKIWNAVCNIFFVTFVCALLNSAIALKYYCV